MLKCLVCVTLLFVTDVVECKPDYLFNQDVNGWLKLHPVPATWQDALMNCHYEGAVLASPINAQLAAALRGIVRQSDIEVPIYLGVNALSTGVFTSFEGVPLADLSITLGRYNYTSKLGLDCLVLGTDGKTYTSSYAELRPYICYKKRDNITILNKCGTFDDDYHLYQATGSCYKYHTKRRSWSLAHKICLAEGGYLVIIDNKQEADIVTGLKPKPKHNMSWEDATYVGLLDRGQDHSFFTIHGDSVEKVYNTWAKGQPDNKGVNLCGLIYGEGTLDDVNCNKELMQFICEKDPNTSRFENIETRLNSICNEGCCS